MLNAMRQCVLLGSIFLAAGQSPEPVIVPASEQTERPVHCAINSILVVDELMNSIVFIWQGILRCGEGKEAAKCSVDVSNAIESVNGMINVILKAVANCGDVINQGAECGAAVTEVTGSMAGVAATSSGIAEHCPKTSMKPIPGLVQEAANPGNPPFSHALAVCIVDSKDLIKAVLRVSVRIADASHLCSDENAANGAPLQGSYECGGGILSVLAAVGEMGEFIAGVVGHCSKPENQPAACAAEVLGLLRNLAKLSGAGVRVGSACSLNEDQRLYLEHAKVAGKIPTNTNSNLSFLGLAALLPMTAVLSFVAGRRMAKYREVPAADDKMQLVE